MGGPGSGDYYRWSKHITKEELRRLDVRIFNKYRWLSTGHSGIYSWTCNDKPSGEIRYAIFERKMILNYQYQEGGEEYKPIKQTVPLSCTRCNYGGERTWFHCPLCNTRVAILYLVSGLFRCRHCHNIPYSSQQEGKLDQLARKARKLRNKLYQKDDIFKPDGLATPIYLKPKNLHWKTYERIKSEELALQKTMGRIMVSRWGQGWY